MGFLKKVFRPVRKIAKKIIPKEIRPVLPYIAAFYGGPAMAGSNTFLSGIGNAALRNAISKGLIAGATAAATDDDANILRTAALAGAPDLISGGLGNVAGRIDPNIANTMAGIDVDAATTLADTGKLAAKTAGVLSRASEGIKGAGALKTIGTQAAIDSAAKFAELNQAEIDKYNQSLLSQGMKSKADRRSAIYNIYINTGAYEPDEINSMLDRYGYEEGGLISLKEFMENFKKRKKAPESVKGFMKSMEKNNRYSRKKAKPLMQSTDKDDEPKFENQEEEEKVYLTRSADPDYAGLMSQALGGIEKAYGKSFFTDSTPMRMGFASGGEIEEGIMTQITESMGNDFDYFTRIKMRENLKQGETVEDAANLAEQEAIEMVREKYGFNTPQFATGGEVEIEEETDDLNIMDFMKDQGIQYGEQASNAQNDEILERLFEEYLELGFSPEDAARKAREEFDRMGKGQGITGTQVASGYKTDIEEMYEQYVFEMEEQGLVPMSFSEFLAQARSGMKDGGKAKRRKKGEPEDTGDEEPGPRSFPEFDKDRLFEEKMPQVLPNKPIMMDAAMGGIAHHARRMEAGGLMNRNLLNTGMDKDMRGGGFIPEGTKEKADDVPARLSKNEFVMTADAVRAAGGGSVNQGAKRMYDLMHNLEAKV